MRSGVYHYQSHYTMMARNALLRSTRRFKKDILFLEEFLFRLQVLQMYRSLMTAIYKHHERADLARFAKQEFQLESKEMDLTQRKYMLQEGIRRINSMAITMDWKFKL